MNSFILNHIQLSPSKDNLVIAASRTSSAELTELQKKHPDTISLPTLDVANTESVKVC